MNLLTAFIYLGGRETDVSGIDSLRRLQKAALVEVGTPPGDLCGGRSPVPGVMCALLLPRVHEQDTNLGTLTWHVGILSRS